MPTIKCIRSVPVENLGNLSAILLFFLSCVLNAYQLINQITLILNTDILQKKVPQILSQLCAQLSSGKTATNKLNTHSQVLKEQQAVEPTNNKKAYTNKFNHTS